MARTEQLLFANKAVNEFVLLNIVSRFDDIYIMMAGLFVVCRQNKLGDFIKDLNLFLVLSGIQLDMKKVEYLMNVIEQKLHQEHRDRQQNEAVVSEQNSTVHALQNRFRSPYKAPGSPLNVKSVSAKSKTIRKNTVKYSPRMGDSVRQKK